MQRFVLNIEQNREWLFFFYFFDHILAAIVHKSFVTTAHPPTGKGGDCGISAFSALL